MCARSFVCVCVCVCVFVCVCVCVCVCVSIGDCLSQHRQCWFGHFSRVDNNRLPKQMFVEGIAPHPRHCPKKRWRDSVMGIYSRLEFLMVGSCSLRRGNNGADFSISSSLGHQLPSTSCANVVGSFAVGTTYRDIRSSAKLNDYHRLRRLVSKGSKVCVGEGGRCVCVCLCVCQLVWFA